MAPLAIRESRRAPRPIPRRAWLPILLAGSLLALHFATWIASLRYTSVGASVLLVSTQPIFGIALSRVFLRESASRATVAGVLVSLAGTALIAGGDLALGPAHLLGDLLALAGAFFAAAYFLIGRTVRERVAFGTYLTGVYGAGACCLLAAALAAGELDRAALGADWPWYLLMAAGPGVLGHGLLNWSVRRVRAYVVSAALLGEPVLATLYAWVIFGERPGAALAGGGALVVLGLIAVLRAMLREEADEPENRNPAEGRPPRL
ncbi:MAG: DMT family transporter [Acidobacteria bacterium]|nr:DMT family transporter [Acidobacteriota bacterium]